MFEIAALQYRECMNEKAKVRILGSRRVKMAYGLWVSAALHGGFQTQTFTPSLNGNIGSCRNLEGSMHLME